MTPSNPVDGEFYFTPSLYDHLMSICQRLEAFADDVNNPSEFRIEIQKIADEAREIASKASILSLPELSKKSLDSISAAFHILRMFGIFS